jgi:hypothetical protein
MGWNLFQNSKKLVPTEKEREILALTSARFRARELYGRLESQGGDYLRKPLSEDKKNAAQLMQQLKPNESRRLIGELKPCAEGAGLFFRGLKIDTLERSAADIALSKIGAGAPVIFELTHVCSRDGERAWPSIVMKPGRIL